MPRAGTYTAVNPVLSTIADSLAGGQTDTIVRFGTLSTRSRPACQDLTPHILATVSFATSKPSSFPAGKSLHDADSQEHVQLPTIANLHLCNSMDVSHGRSHGIVRVAVCPQSTLRELIFRIVTYSQVHLNFRKIFSVLRNLRRARSPTTLL